MEQIMKTTNTLKIIMVSLSLTFGTSSFAAYAADTFDVDQVKEGQIPYAAEFTKLDTSGDELLSRSEAAKDKIFTRKHFAKADVDNDGTLDKNEYVTYRSAVEKKNAKRVVSDSVITTKAKAKILSTKDLKSLQISVETHQGEVLLSGFVDSEAAKQKAEEVVSQINGVKSVKNSLEVKS